MKPLLAATVALALGGILAAQPLTAAQQQRRTDDRQQTTKLFVARYDKASYIVRRLYHYGDRRDFLPYVGYLIAEHQRLERKSGQRGFGAAYFFSMIYSAANFGMRCYATAPGWCAGPMDTKTPGRYLLDPRANIRHHVAEMLDGYRRGYRDRGLCEYVFTPANPRDWGGGRFRRTEAKMRDCLARGQRLGRVGPARAQRNPVAAGAAGEPSKRKGDER